MIGSSVLLCVCVCVRERGGGGRGGGERAGESVSTGIISISKFIPTQCIVNVS